MSPNLSAKSSFEKSLDALIDPFLKAAGPVDPGSGHGRTISSSQGVVAPSSIRTGGPSSVRPQSGARMRVGQTPSQRVDPPPMPERSFLDETRDKLNQEIEKVARGGATDRWTCRLICNMAGTVFKGDDLKESVNFFSRLQSLTLTTGFHLTPYPCDLLMKAQIRLGGKQGARDACQLFEQMMSAQSQSDPLLPMPDTYCMSSLVKAHEVLGTIEEAESIVLSGQPDIWVFHRLAEAYGTACKPGKVEALRGPMRKMGIQPDRKFLDLMARAHGRVQYR